MIVLTDLNQINKMKKAEEISHEICDKYALSIDLSIPIEDAVKQAREDAIDECLKYLEIDYPDGYEQTRNNILKLKEDL